MVYEDVSDPDLTVSGSDLTSVIRNLRNKFEDALTASIEESRGIVIDHKYYHIECDGEANCHGRNCTFCHWEMPEGFDNGCNSILQLLNPKEFSSDDRHERKPVEKDTQSYNSVPFAYPE
jgi:hypothetical protein